VKSLNEFWRNRSKWDGYKGECKTCDMARRDGSHVRTHGYSGYTHGCRCDICTDAKADYMASRRNKAFLADYQVPEHITHGSQFAYDEHGCRCEACVDARRAASRRVKA
jgi:hypothetical protein